MIVKGGYNASTKYKSKGVSWKAANFKAIGASLGHLKYIKNRPGEDKEKGGRDFFDAESDKADEKEFQEAVKKMDTKGPVIHKIMLGPDVTPVDQKKFTREVMKELAERKGQDLRWQAVEHRNTDNPHVHVVVLGKDRDGREVRFTKDDYNKLREHAGKILDRDYPLAREEKRLERELADREKRDQRKEKADERAKARREKIAKGEHLPWFRQKVVREQLEPYSEWKRKQEEKELLPEPCRKESVEKEENKHSTIHAKGRSYTRKNTLKELKELDKYLREDHKNYIPLEEYKELSSWIGSKEKEAGLSKGSKGLDKDADPNKFTYDGKEYTKESSREDLNKLNKHLYENKHDQKKRLPAEDYLKLNTWLEEKDRKYMADFVDKHAEKLILKDEREKNDVDSKVGGKMIDPLQHEVGSNPALGVIVKAGQVIANVVGQIRLDDLSDHLKEAHQYLMDAYGEVKESVLEKTGHQKDATGEEKTLGDLNQGIDRVKEQKHERVKKEAEKREKAQKDRDREMRDGMIGFD